MCLFVQANKITYGLMLIDRLKSGGCFHVGFYERGGCCKAQKIGG